MTAVEPAGAERLDRYASEPAKAAVVPGEASVEWRRGAAEASAQVLSFAGLLLAPERSAEQDQRLAHSLLREAFVGAARALTGKAWLDTVGEAQVALEAREDLPSALQGSRGARLCRALENRAPLAAAESLELEANVGELVRLAGREHQPGSRRRRWLALAAIPLLAALALIVPRLQYMPSWFGFEWQASSAVAGYPTSGTLGQHHDGLVFHTDQQAEPWVLIDMKESRSVAAIVIKNRTNCCTERGLPLVVELGKTKETLTVVGRKTDVFDEWNLTFVPREARYVRLRSEGTTYLQLKDVAIR